MSDKDLQRVTEFLSYIGQDQTHRTADTPFSNLSPKEEAFCLAIVEGLNESDAYRRAYKPQRAKPKTIHEKASRIMARGKVRARIAELMGPLIAQAQMTRTEWLQQLTRCCRFDPRKMFDAHGKHKPITELEENEAAAIEQYELHAEVPDPGGSRKAIRVKIKFSNRLSALALLGKACNWYADGREETGVPIQKEIVVRFVKPSLSPEDAYRRLVGGPTEPRHCVDQGN